MVGGKDGVSYSRGALCLVSKCSIFVHCPLCKSGQQASQNFCGFCLLSKGHILQEGKLMAMLGEAHPASRARLTRQPSWYMGFPNSHQADSPAG